MGVTNFSKKRAVGSYQKVGNSSFPTTAKSEPTTTNFSGGITTYKPNDSVKYTEVYLAQNARFDRIGEYATRHGIKPLCEPIGKTTVYTNYTASFGLVETPISTTFTPSAGGRLYSVNVTASKTSAAYGVLQMTILDADENVLGVSCADPTAMSTTATDTEFVFVGGVGLEAASPVTISLSTQSGGSAKFNVATVGGSLMFKVQTAYAGKVTSIFEANIDDVRTILFTFKDDDDGSTTMYRMAENGTTTAMRSLPSGVDRVRYCQNINMIRYADGQEGPRLIDPSDGWIDKEITTKDLKTNVDLGISVSNILDGAEDNLMYFDAGTTTQAVWTYPYGFTFAREADYVTTDSIAAYDETQPQPQTSTIHMNTLTPSTSSVTAGDIIVDSVGHYGTVDASASGSTFTVSSIAHIAAPINTYDGFDRDFRQNFPAIETGDPLTAMFNLGGVVYFLTRRNKYYMYSQTADVWSQAVASAQHGTFSQESTVCDLNYAYYACDDGVYVFDGSSEASLSHDTIQNVYDAIPDKEKIVLQLYANRLYVFHPSTAGGENDRCLIYNINLKVWESFDTGAYVHSAIARKTVSNRLICGSSRFSVLYTYDDKEAPYSDSGAPIAFDIETSYLNFGTPSQLHRITKWRPEFATTSAPYYVRAGYALDFTDDVQYAYSINLFTGQPFNESYVWDDPSDYGVATVPTLLSTIPVVNGQFRRCQIRYQCHGAYTPVNFKSHTLCVQTERIR